MNEVICRHCGWIWEDTPGMGVHRGPTNCVKCDGKMIIRPIPQSIAKFACGLQLEGEDDS